MKLRVLGLLMLAGYTTAQAQEVTATKKSAGQQVSDNLYGDIEARVQSFRYTDSNGHTQANRMLTLRPKLGTKVADGKLDLNLTLPINNRQSSSVTERGQPEALADLTIYSSDRLLVSLNTTNYLQTNEKVYDGYVDLDVTFMRDFDRLSVGTVSTSLMIEGDVQLGTKKRAADIASREYNDGTALTEDDTANAPAMEQKEGAKSIVFYPKVALAPKILPGLKLSVASLFWNTYVPKYDQVLNEDGDYQQKDAGFAVSRGTQARYTVSYKISDTLSVYNQLRHNIDGYAQAGLKSGTELDNRTGITMTMF